MSVIVRDKLTSEQKKLIRELLYFQAPTSFFGGAPQPILFYQVDEGVRLPLAMARSLGWDNDKDYPLTDAKFTGTLLDKQKPVVEEAINQLTEQGSTLLHLPTGFGKTVIASYLACQTRLVTLVLITFTTLIPSWQETFLQFTNIRPWIVGDKWEGEILRNQSEGPQVLICMEERCDKIPPSLVEKIGLVIVDECHTFYTTTRVKALLYCQPRYVIACSATPYKDVKSKGGDDMIVALVGLSKVYRPLEVSFGVTRITTGIVPKITLNKKGVPDWSSINKSLANHEGRNTLILETVKANPNWKTLILVWLADHALLLTDLFQREGISVAVMARNAKKYSDSQVLIGTIGKLGTGFDEKMACPDFQGVRINLLILAGSTKSPQLLAQLCGRAFRSEMPHIVDIVDNHGALEKHWRKRLKWYRDNNAVIDMG